jgi:hypothetical protein
MMFTEATRNFEMNDIPGGHVDPKLMRLFDQSCKKTQTPHSKQLRNPYLFFTKCSRFDVQDWLCSENLKVNSPLTDKWIAIDSINHVCSIATRASGIRAQKSASFHHRGWELVRLRIDSRRGMESMRWEHAACWEQDYPLHREWRIAGYLLRFDWMCPKHHWCKWRLYVRVNIPIKMIILHASSSINGWVTDWTPYTEHYPSATLHSRGIKSRWPISK